MWAPRIVTRYACGSGRAQCSFWLDFQEVLPHVVLCDCSQGVVCPEIQAPKTTVPPGSLPVADVRIGRGKRSTIPPRPFLCAQCPPTPPSLQAAQAREILGMRPLANRSTLLL
jgi:hypothetical protein